MTKTAIIRNLELHYVNVFKEHSPFGTPIWDVQIRTTDEDKVKELMDLGINMKKHKDGYYHANVKRKVQSSKGERNIEVQVVDAAKNQIDRNIKIGNGSIGHIKVFSYDWEQMGRSGKSSMLQAIQIIELKEFTGNDDVDFDIEESTDF